MLRNILGLHERRIADVMIPRADIVAVKRDIPLGELMSLFESAAHSRLVVYNETLDDPEGIVHIRDLMAFMTAKRAVEPRPARPSARSRFRPASICAPSISRCRSRDANIIRKLLYVPPSMRAIDLLAQMQASRIHLALVVDEYGGTDGLVSIEDIVEQIVGEIDDEHDSDEPPAIVRQADNSFIADARASLDDVRTVIGEDFITGEAGEEVETLGGYLVTQVGRLPVRGEVISGPGNYEIEVLDADPRRVKRLRIAARKERPAPRTQRESRRREAAPDANRAAGQRQCAAAVRRRSRLAVNAASKLRTRRSCDHPGLGLEARRHRAGRRRAVGAGDGAVQCLAGAVPDLSGRGLADRRRRRRTLARRAGGGDGRLVVRLRLFRAGLYWIGYAFLVDAPTFAWLMPFAVLGLPAYLALFTAFGFALARLLWTRDASRMLALAAALTIAEWLRGHLLTGFPWNAFGYALTEPLALAQTASLIGLWGLTFLSVAIFASPAVLIDGTSRGRKPWIAPVAALAAARRRWPCSARSGCRCSRPLRRPRSSCASCSPTCSRTSNSTTPPRRR